MPKANLTLIGASLSLNAESAKSILASECQLSDADLDAACNALFELKEPFVLCKEVELAVAANHFGQLKERGIDCEVEVLSLQDADDNSNTGLIRNCALAAVCVLSLGAGYFFYSQKSDQQLPIVAEHFSKPDNTVEIAAQTELTEFHRWRDRLNGIESLKRKIDRIPTKQYTDEFIASLEDPLIRTIGVNYVTQRSIQKLDSGIQYSQIAEHHKDLEASVATINSYPATLDRFYAKLDLAGVYQQLRKYSAAQSTYRLALDLVSDGEMNRPEDIVIAEVALAEHQHLHGQTDDRDAHLAAATAAVTRFDEGSDDLREWALAYIARGEAKFGLFTKAHGRLKSISDEQIKDSAMIDISRYAASINHVPDFELPDLTSREY